LADARAAALERYEEFKSSLGYGEGAGCERLVSCSDDFTLFLWTPSERKQPLQRMVRELLDHVGVVLQLQTSDGDAHPHAFHQTGHQGAVTGIAFSANGRYIASGGFDKKVKLWSAKTGDFIATLTGHVSAVYQIVWSADSRLIVSASKDSTMKLWETRSTKKARGTLPGHADEVYAVDWSPDGVLVASGSKDRTIKIWRN